MHLDVMEFLRRFLQHVLPNGLRKVRHCGLLHPSCAIPLHTLRVMIVQAHPRAGKPTQRASPTTARGPLSDLWRPDACRDAPADLSQGLASIQAERTRLVHDGRDAVPLANTRGTRASLQPTAGSQGARIQGSQRCMERPPRCLRVPPMIHPWMMPPHSVRLSDTHPPWTYLPSKTPLGWQAGLP